MSTLTATTAAADTSTPTPVAIVRTTTTRDGNPRRAVLLSDGSLVRYQYEDAETALTSAGIPITRRDCQTLVDVEVTPHWYRSRREFYPR